MLVLVNPQKRMTEMPAESPVESPVSSSRDILYWHVPVRWDLKKVVSIFW